MMLFKKHYFFSPVFFFLIACNAQKNTSINSVNDNGIAIAFPGAEGFGKYTTGGRGGKVFIVTNLHDNGPGSFREAAEAKGKRIIVFAVSGTIHLETKLSIRADASIAGQTAPGDGICIADQAVVLNGDNIIVRYLRFRLGDKWQRQKGMVDGSGSDDAFGGFRRKLIIIDHCTFSWSNDEAFSVYAGDSSSFQWNLIAEPLNYSYHFETGDKDFEHHGYGGIWGGKHLSAHHNLFAHCNSRTPRFDGIRNISEEFVDFRNNVLYNWGGNNVYGGEGGNYNIVGNYYKYGPSTNKNIKFRIVNPNKREDPPIAFGKYFVSGNYVDGAPDVSGNNWLGIHMGNDGTEADKKQTVQGSPFPTESITSQSAQEAYELVLEKAGASFRRDTLDMRIIKDVRMRTGKFIDVQGGYVHGTPFDLTLHAWPVLKSLPASPDNDKDGMPDEWEKSKGLNSSDASDAAGNNLHKFYTNIEVYINTIVSVIINNQ